MKLAFEAFTFGYVSSHSEVLCACAFSAEVRLCAFALCNNYIQMARPRGD